MPPPQKTKNKTQNTKKQKQTYTHTHLLKYVNKWRHYQFESFSGKRKQPENIIFTLIKYSIVFFFL